MYSYKTCFFVCLCTIHNSDPDSSVAWYMDPDSHVNPLVYSKQIVIQIMCISWCFLFLFISIFSPTFFNFHPGRTTRVLPAKYAPRAFSCKRRKNMEKMRERGSAAPLHRTHIRESLQIFLNLWMAGENLISLDWIQISILIINMDIYLSTYLSQLEPGFWYKSRFEPRSRYLS